MKKPLEHSDIVKGRRYKVIATPKHCIGIGNYPWLNMEGVALWSDAGHKLVGLEFKAGIRGVPPDCLEEVEGQQMIIDCTKLPPAEPGDGLRLLYENFAREKAAEEEKKKNMVTPEIVKMHQPYRIVKTPPFWQKVSDSKTQKYPALGDIGKLINVRNNFGTLRMSNGTQRFVPFDCMELVTIRVPELRETPMDLSDEALIEKMKLKPKSTLKIIKGLAKMNKDYRLRAFLDRGVIF